MSRVAPQPVQVEDYESDENAVRLTTRKEATRKKKAPSKPPNALERHGKRRQNASSDSGYSSRTTSSRISDGSTDVQIPPTALAPPISTKPATSNRWTRPKPMIHRSDSQRSKLTSGNETELLASIPSTRSSSPSRPQNDSRYLTSRAQYQPSPPQHQYQYTKPLPGAIQTVPTLTALPRPRPGRSPTPQTRSPSIHGYFPQTHGYGEQSGPPLSASAYQNTAHLNDYRYDHRYAAWVLTRQQRQQAHQPAAGFGAVPPKEPDRTAAPIAPTSPPGSLAALPGADLSYSENDSSSDDSSSGVSENEYERYRRARTVELSEYERAWTVAQSGTSPIDSTPSEYTSLAGVDSDRTDRNVVERPRTTYNTSSRSSRQPSVSTTASSGRRKATTMCSPKSGLASLVVERKNGRKISYRSKYDQTPIDPEYPRQTLVEHRRLQAEIEAYQAAVLGPQGPQLTAENIREELQLRRPRSSLSTHGRAGRRTSSKVNRGFEVASGGTVLRVSGDLPIEIRYFGDGASAQFVAGSTTTHDSPQISQSSNGEGAICPSSVDGIVTRGSGAAEHVSKLEPWQQAHHIGKSKPDLHRSTSDMRVSTKPKRRDSLESANDSQGRLEIGGLASPPSETSDVHAAVRLGKTTESYPSAISTTATVSSDFGGSRCDLDLLTMRNNFESDMNLAEVLPDFEAIIPEGSSRSSPCENFNPDEAIFEQALQTTQQYAAISACNTSDSLPTQENVLADNSLEDSISPFSGTIAEEKPIDISLQKRDCISSAIVDMATQGSRITCQAVVSERLDGFGPENRATSTDLRHQNSVDASSVANEMGLVEDSSRGSNKSFVLVDDFNHALAIGSLRTEVAELQNTVRGLLTLPDLANSTRSSGTAERSVSRPTNRVTGRWREFSRSSSVPPASSDSSPTARRASSEPPHRPSLWKGIDVPGCSSLPLSSESSSNGKFYRPWTSSQSGTSDSSHSSRSQNPGQSPHKDGPRARRYCSRGIKPPGNDSGKFACIYYHRWPEHFRGHTVRFQYMSKLHEHLRSEHKLYICQRCFYRYPTKNQLKQHETINSLSPCGKSCDDRGCRRYLHPTSGVPLESSFCECITSSEGQYREACSLLTEDDLIAAITGVTSASRELEQATSVNDQALSDIESHSEQSISAPQAIGMTNLSGAFNSRSELSMDLDDPFLSDCTMGDGIDWNQLVAEPDHGDYGELSRIGQAVSEPQLTCGGIVQSEGSKTPLSRSIPDGSSTVAVLNTTNDQVTPSQGKSRDSLASVAVQTSTNFQDELQSLERLTEVLHTRLSQTGEDILPNLPDLRRQSQELRSRMSSLRSLTDVRQDVQELQTSIRELRPQLALAQQRMAQPSGRERELESMMRNRDSAINVLWGELQHAGGGEESIRRIIDRMAPNAIDAPNTDGSLMSSSSVGVSLWDGGNILAPSIDPRSLIAQGKQPEKGA